MAMQSEPYSLKVYMESNLLRIEMRYTNTKQIYGANFDSDSMQTHGLPAAMKLESVKKFIENAVEKKEGYNLAVKTENEAMLIDVDKADDVFPIQLKNLRLKKIKREKADILGEYVDDLKTEVANLRQSNQNLEQTVSQLSQKNQSLESSVSQLTQSLQGLTASFNVYKDKMRWKVFNGNAFDKNKEYRVRMNEGGGYNAVEIFDSQTMFFRCSTANHFYGCIEVTNLHRWHYRHCGNSATKVKGYEDNGYVHSIEERG